MASFRKKKSSDYGALITRCSRRKGELNQGSVSEVSGSLEDLSSESNEE